MGLHHFTLFHFSIVAKTTLGKLRQQRSVVNLNLTLWRRPRNYYTMCDAVAADTRRCCLCVSSSSGAMASQTQSDNYGCVSKKIFSVKEFDHLLKLMLAERTYGYACPLGLDMSRMQKVLPDPLCTFLQSFITFSKCIH